MNQYRDRKGIQQSTTNARGTGRHKGRHTQDTATKSEDPLERDFSKALTQKAAELANRQRSPDASTKTLPNETAIRSGVPSSTSAETGEHHVEKKPISLIQSNHDPDGERQYFEHKLKASATTFVPFQVSKSTATAKACAIPRPVEFGSGTKLDGREGACKESVGSRQDNFLVHDDSDWEVWKPGDLNFERETGVQPASYAQAAATSAKRQKIATECEHLQPTAPLAPDNLGVTQSQSQNYKIADTQPCQSGLQQLCLQGQDCRGSHDVDLHNKNGHSLKAGVNAETGHTQIEELRRRIQKLESAALGERMTYQTTLDEQSRQIRNLQILAAVNSIDGGGVDVKRSFEAIFKEAEEVILDLVDRVCECNPERLDLHPRLSRNYRDLLTDNIPDTLRRLTMAACDHNVRIPAWLNLAIYQLVLIYVIDEVWTPFVSTQSRCFVGANGQISTTQLNNVIETLLKHVKASELHPKMAHWRAMTSKAVWKLVAERDTAKESSTAGKTADFVYALADDHVDILFRYKLLPLLKFVNKKLLHNSKTFALATACDDFCVKLKPLMVQLLQTKIKAQGEDLHSHYTIEWKETRIDEYIRPKSYLCMQTPIFRRYGADASGKADKIPAVEKATYFTAGDAGWYEGSIKG